MNTLLINRESKCASCDLRCREFLPCDSRVYMYVYIYIGRVARRGLTRENGVIGGFLAPFLFARPCSISLVRSRGRSEREVGHEDLCGLAINARA